MADVVNISPNMGMSVPVPQQSPGPQWAQDIYACLYNVLDQHNHSPGQGIAIPPAGLNINAPLTFQTNSATNLLSAGFVSQVSPLSLAGFPASLYVSGGNLYFNSASTQIQLTTATNVNATSSGITSGTASASFISSVLVVNEAANTPANIQAGSYKMGDNTTDGFFVTLQPPTLSSSYSITLPSLPASTLPVVLSSTGNLSTTNNLTVSTLTSPTINVGSGGSQLTSTGSTLVVSNGLFPSGTADALLSGLTANTLQVTDTVSASSFPIVVSAVPSTSGLLVYRGLINSSGGISSGEGFSVTHTGTGTYHIIFLTNLFIDLPSVVCSLAQAGTSGFISTSSVGSGSCTIVTSNTSNIPTDLGFCFIAVGQRNN